MEKHKDFDEQFWGEGYRLIGGVDEVGRGALAGKLMVGIAVRERKTRMCRGITDSKKLSPKKRLIFYEELVGSLESYSLGEASAREIDEYGINQAVLLAIRRALEQVGEVDLLLIDGNYKENLLDQIGLPYRSIIRGDELSYTIGAASIMAKVERDEAMRELAKVLPHYGWESNKGYGTKFHRCAISKYGLSEWHRLSFCSRLV